MAATQAAARDTVREDGPQTGGSFSATPRYEIKEKQKEREFKLIVPERMVRDDKDALALMEEILGSKAVLGPPVTYKHKTRDILDTDARDIMLKIGGFLTLTHESDGRTKQRFKDITTPAEDGMMERPERTAVIFDTVAGPILQAIKSRRIRGELAPLMDRIRTQGTMDYHSHKGRVLMGKHGEDIITVSLDRGFIRPRFAHIAPVPFRELEVDTHEKDTEALRRTVGLIQDRYGFEISTTPKEMLLLDDPDMIAALNASQRQAGARPRQSTGFRLGAPAFAGQA